jgi:hypothetical protein
VIHELLTYAGLGFAHITGAGALDHLLFLLVLAAGFEPRGWKSAAWTISAFTAGHSLTLALVVTTTVRMPERAVEVLIPLTIVAAACEAFRAGGATHRRAWLALGFGTIHGAGFAGYLRDLFDGGIGTQLAGFNLGIEAAQLIVLGGLVAALRVIDVALSIVQPPAVAARRRLAAVSISAGLAGLVMAASRLPWS